jgi:hypothetical protein
VKAGIKFLLLISFVLSSATPLTLFAAKQGGKPNSCSDNICCSSILRLVPESHSTKPAKSKEAGKPAVVNISTRPKPPTPPAHYEVVAGNSEIGAARVIGLGEEHGDMAQMQRAIDLINKYAKDGDIILMEGLDAGTIGNKEDYVPTHGIKPNVTVMGWDKVPLITRSLELVRQFIDSNFDPAVDARVAPELNNLTRQRDMSLVQTLSSQLQRPGDHRVFILAGFEHFNPKRSTLNYIMGTQNVPHLLLKPVRATGEADDAALRQHFDAQMRHKPEGQ